MLDVVWGVLFVGGAYALILRLLAGIRALERIAKVLERSEQRAMGGK